MKDIEFLETVLPKIRKEFDNRSIENKIANLIFLPVVVVSFSEEPLKVKFLLYIISLIILPMYLIFLIFTLPFLLLASLVLELHHLRIRTVLSYFPTLLLILFIMSLISGFGLGYSLVTVNNDFATLPLDIQNGNWNRSSELFLNVNERFVVNQIVSTLLMIGFYIITFYFVFIRRKYPFLIEEEKENLIMFFKKSFFFIPIYLTYIILPATKLYIDFGTPRTTAFYNYYTDLFSLIWLLFGFSVFYGIFLLIRLNFFVRKKLEGKKTESELDVYEDDNDDDGGLQEKNDSEIDEKLDKMIQNEIKEDEEIEQRIEDLVQDEMKDKSTYDKATEERIEELVEEEMNDTEKSEE